MTDQTPAGDAQESRIQLDRIYLKDVSFESPQTPALFAGEDDWQPRMNLHLETEAAHVRDDRYEVALRVTVTATDGERTVFLVELKQAGLFRLSGFDEAQLKQALAIACPNMLFPFAREALDSLVQRGGMPPLLLQPINFASLQTRQAAQRANPEAAPAAGDTGATGTAGDD